MFCQEYLAIVNFKLFGVRTDLNIFAATLSGYAVTNPVKVHQPLPSHFSGSHSGIGSAAPMPATATNSLRPVPAAESSW